MTQKISIIIPIYNVKAYLKRCLDSVINQSYKNLEILLVDDGSTDGCADVCDAYAIKDSRISVMHISNSGVAAARNVGLSKATGEWIGFVDADDYIDSDMYEYLMSLTTTDTDVVQCGVYFEDRNKKNIKFTPDLNICISGISGQNKSEYSYYAPNVWCKLFHKKFIHLRFNEEFNNAEDLWFSFQVLQSANQIILGNQGKYHYLQYANSLCHNFNTEQELLSANQVYRNICSELADTAAKQYYQDEMIRNYFYICLKIVESKKEDFQKQLSEYRNKIKALLPYIKKGDFTRKEYLKFLCIGKYFFIFKILICLRHVSRGAYYA